MSQGEAILRFDKVTFAHGLKPILEEVDFSLRRGFKATLMGQNGAGKSTIFNLINGSLEPDSGKIHLGNEISVALAKQVIPKNMLNLTIRDFFQSCFKEKVYDIDPKIDKILQIVNLSADHERIIKSFSGGQQARLLLASAIIQDPDLLLLDEPTNNLDKEGIAHLTKFLVDYKKTCLVISHDAEFLNAFTQGVLYLDVFTKKVEQYVGNYFDLLKEISARIERENRKNAQLEKEIQEKKDKANYFSHKGGHLRFVAKQMRAKVEEMEDEKVDVRKEDKTIRPFVIPIQEGIGGEIIRITSFSVMKNHKAVQKTADISLRKKEKLLLKGPNGIGKTTLLESLASGKAKGAVISPGIVVGYYRQDFSTLNFDETVGQSFSSANEDLIEGDIRSLAAGFLITGDMINAKIGSLSEGQKGLVCLCRLVLQKPGLLIVDEPTNHINFRHIPIIAQALNNYEGAMVLVSHAPEFLEQIRINQTLDLEK